MATPFVDSPPNLTPLTPIHESFSSASLAASDTWFEETRSLLNSKNFYLSKIKAMHCDTKGSKSNEYYKRPFIDPRPDFVLRVQKAMFLMFCDFFDSKISEPNSFGCNNLDDEQTPARSFHQAMTALCCGGGGQQAAEGNNVPGEINRLPSWSKPPSSTRNNSIKIHRSEVLALLLRFCRPRHLQRPMLTPSRHCLLPR